MLDSIYISATEEEKEELRQLILNLQGDEILTGCSDPQARLLHVMLVHMNGLELKLTDNEIKTILSAETTDVQEIEALILKQHGKKLHPTVKLALQAGLCLAAIYYAPELLALHAGKELTKKFITNHYSEKAADLLDTALLALSYYGGLPQLNMLSQLNQALPESAKTSYFKQIPCFVLATALLKNASEPLEKLAVLPFDKKVTEKAGDFFDIMHGQTDNVDRSKYKGCLATMTIEELTDGISHCLSWAWHKMPSLRNQVAVKQPLTVKKKDRKSNESLRHARAL